MAWSPDISAATSGRLRQGRWRATSAPHCAAGWITGSAITTRCNGCCMGGVILALCLIVATGLSIWKPVQFGWLTDVFGGYPVARGIHLAAMLAIAAFVVLHVALALMYPRTIVSMVSGVPAEPEVSTP